MTMRSRAVYLVLLAAFPAAGQTESGEVSAPPLPQVTISMELLAEADTALDRGELEKARALYERIVRDYPDSPEAHASRRVLKAMQLASGRQLVPGQRGDLAYQLEPYSAKTLERVRLSTWEKLDFGITAFMYGAAVGFSYANAIPRPDTPAVILPIVVGSLAYTAGAVAFLRSADPDRGDLPLALAVSAYVPTGTLLTLLALWPNPNGTTVSLITALAGTAAVPVAVLLAMNVDLDPGDTQLARDAGFWGMVLGVTGAFAFADPFRGGPSTQLVGTAGMIGLYGGLGIGLALALNTEVTLERVRVTTWGGYGGAVIGLLLATAASQGRTPVPGIFFGSMVGLTVTFLATSGIDEIPAEAPRVAGRRLSPTVIPLSDGRGFSGAALGLTGALP